MVKRSALSVEAQIHEIHDRVCQEFPGIGRIAIAMYDEHSDLLRTFVNSTRGACTNLLSHYDVALKDVPSLEQLARERRDRVIDDLSVFADSQAPHSRVVAEHFGSSYTRPIFDCEELQGFTFFNAYEPGYFQREVVQRMGIYGDLVGHVVARSRVPGRRCELRPRQRRS